MLFGMSARTDLGNPTVPGALAMTWIDVDSLDEQVEGQGRTRGCCRGCARSRASSAGSVPSPGCAGTLPHAGTSPEAAESALARSAPHRGGIERVHAASAIAASPASGCRTGSTRTEADSLPDRVTDLGLGVDLLVNNAGFGTYGRFVELDADREVEEVRVNCEAVVTLTHAFLPAMVERGRGASSSSRPPPGCNRFPTRPCTAPARRSPSTSPRPCTRSCAGPASAPSPSTPVPSPPSGRRSPGTPRPGSYRAKSPAEQVVGESLSRTTAVAVPLHPGRTIRWFIRATSPWSPLLQLRITSAVYGRGIKGAPTASRRRPQPHVGMVLERLRDRPLDLAQRPRPASGGDASGLPSASTMNRCASADRSNPPPRTRCTPLPPPRPRTTTSPSASLHRAHDVSSERTRAQA